MSNNELQKPIIPLASGQKTPAKTAVALVTPQIMKSYEACVNQAKTTDYLWEKIRGCFASILTCIKVVKNTR